MNAENASLKEANPLFNFLYDRMAKNGRTIDMTKTKIVAIGFTKIFSSITYAVRENKIPTAEIIKPKFNAVFFIFSFMMFFLLFDKLTNTDFTVS